MQNTPKQGDRKKLVKVAAGAGVGAWLGSGVGIAVAGTAISGTLPLAVLCGVSALVYQKIAEKKA